MAPEIFLLRVDHTVCSGDRIPDCSSSGVLLFDPNQQIVGGQQRLHRKRVAAVVSPCLCGPVWVLLVWVRFVFGDVWQLSLENLVD